MLKPTCYAICTIKIAREYFCLVAEVAVLNSQNFGRILSKYILEVCKNYLCILFVLLCYLSDFLYVLCFFCCGRRFDSCTSMWMLSFLSDLGAARTRSSVDMRNRAGE